LPWRWPPVLDRILPGRPSSHEKALASPGCVEGTGRWGMELGYSVTLVKDASAAFTKEHMHAATELNGPLYAESVIVTSELITALQTAA